MAITRNDLPELSKGADQLVAQVADTQRAKQERALRELLKGKEIEADANLKQMGIQADVDKQTRNMTEAERLRGKYGEKTSVTVGDAHIGGTDPLMGLLRQQAVNDRHEARADNQVRGISDRVEKTGLPLVKQAYGAVKDSFKGDSVGPFMNMLPKPLHALAANVTGAGKEYQDLQRLMNIDTKNFSGSAVSTHEMGRQLVEKGLSMGGSPEMVRRGVEMMRQAAQGQGKNIAAGSNPQSLGTYESQLGESLNGVLDQPMPELGGKAQIAPGPSAQETPEQKYMRLKQKYGK